MGVNDKRQLLDKLQKIKHRNLKLVMPNETCHAVGTHLAGMYLIEHIDYLIVLLKEDIELDE